MRSVPCIANTRAGSDHPCQPQKAVISFKAECTRGGRLDVRTLNTEWKMQQWTVHSREPKNQLRPMLTVLPHARMSPNANLVNDIHGASQGSLPGPPYAQCSTSVEASDSPYAMNHPAEEPLDVMRL